MVQPTSPSQANLISGQTSNVTAVSEISAKGSNGGRLLRLASAPVSTPPPDGAVSPEVSYSSGEAPGMVASTRSTRTAPASAFEVDTFAPGTTTLTSGYAFTIVVP